MPNHLVRCAFAGLLAAGLAAQDDLAARLRVLIEKTKTVSGSSALGLLESALRELPDPPDAETPRSLVDWYWHVSNAAEWAGSKAQGETRKQLLAVAARGWRSYIAFYATQPVEDNENDRQNIQAARRRLIARLDLDGKYPEAIAVQDAVVRLLRVTAGPDGRETLHEEINLALFQNRNHQHADAQRTTRAALERIEKRFAGSPLHARARTQLASTINDRGWYWDDEVLELQRDAVAIYEAILARPPSEDTAQLQRHAASELATTRWELAQTYLNRGDYSKARRLAQRSYDALIADRGKDSEDTSWARGILAHALHSLGDLSESLRLYKTNLRLRIKQRGDDHPFTSLVRTNVGAVLL
ncbi:MAG: tetratricopeptide repeat protein, partial [Planctomycetota bacterium]